MSFASAPPAAHRSVSRVSVRDRVESLSGQGVVQVVLLLVALGFIAAFAGTSLLRAIYPFPLDGLERGALQEVARIRAWQPIYVAPELGYVPFIYGPVYYAAAAGVASVTGANLFALRSVSLLASLGSIALIALLVRRETGSLAMGLVGGAVLAACDPFLDGAMSLGRVDALSVCLLLAAIYVARIATIDPGATWRSSALSGGLMGLALLTKQSGAPVAAAVLLVFLVTRRNQLGVHALALAATFGVGFLLIAYQTWPWAWFYLWELPRLHQVTREFLMNFWGDFVAHAAFPALIGPFYLVGRALVGDRKRILFYAAVTAGMFAMAWITRATIGGARNVELPAFAVTALLFGLGLHEIVAQIGGATPRARLIRSYVQVAAIGGFACLIYNPRLWVPYRSDLWADERTAATLAELPGPIFAGSYEGFVDGAPDAIAPDLAAINEIQGERVRPSTEPGNRWSDQFTQALHDRTFTYVIVDPENPVVIVPILTKDYGYVDLGPLFPSGDKFWQWRTGGWTPQAEVYARPDLARTPLPAPTGGP